MGATPPAISVQGVSKRFRIHQERAHSIKEAIVSRRRTRPREFWALRDLTLDVPKGSFFGLMGHNGSGKSTLLRLMAGIHEPTTGTIVADGRISALLELGSGFHPDLTGRENIFLNGAMLGLRRKQMAVAVDQIIEFSGIGDFIDAPVKVYSSGMQVRLGFAIAVHVDPEILLVDEVIAVGDEEFQRKCLDHIHGLRRRGTTIILVTHSAPMMEAMCDEVAWIDHGRLQRTGPASGVVRAYLEHVNLLEHERLAALNPVETNPDDADGSRHGSGEIRVRSLELLASDRSRVVAARSGDPLVVRMHFEAHSTVENPVFGVGIHLENGTLLAAPNSGESSGVGTVVPGAGHIDLVLDRLPLLPGSYLVSTSVTGANQLSCLDAWELWYQLVVQPGSATERNGVIELRPAWLPAEADDAADRPPTVG